MAGLVKGMNGRRLMSDSELVAPEIVVEFRR